MTEQDGRNKDVESTAPLTADERELLRLWRATDDEGRRYIMAAAQSQEGWRGGYRLV